MQTITKESNTIIPSNDTEFNRRFYYVNENNNLKTPCDRRPFSQIQVGSVACSNCKFHIGNNRIARMVLCDYFKYYSHIECKFPIKEDQKIKE